MPSRSEMGRARDIYIAIMVAAASGRGVNLSWEECDALALDDSIATRALNGLEICEYDLVCGPGSWENIDPWRTRAPANFASLDPEGIVRARAALEAGDE